MTEEVVKQSIAARRSRPEMELKGAYPLEDCGCMHQTNAVPRPRTPIRTPSLETSDTLSPPDRTPSPVRSLGVVPSDMRMYDEEDGGPLSLEGSTMNATGGRRPNFTRSQSALNSATDRHSSATYDHYGVLSAHSRAAFVAREVALQRRASDGNPQVNRSDANAGSAALSRAHQQHRTTSICSTSSSHAYSSLDIAGRGHARQPTVSSTIASSGPLTPSDEDAVNAAVMFSWGIGGGSPNEARRLSEAMRSFDIGGSKDTHADASAKKVATSLEAVEDKSYRGGAGLMGNGHFGPGVRQHVSMVLERLLEDVPMEGEREEVIALCEYGALNSRSATLMTETISRLARRHQQLLGKESNANFHVTHADSPLSDFRPVAADVELSDSYLSPTWQAMHDPPLSDRAFSAFAGRSRHLQILPPRSVSVGISLFDLHWAKAPHRVGETVSADQELRAFLKARAAEFRAGGLLVFAFIQRSEESSSRRPLSFGSDGDWRTSRLPSLDEATRAILNVADDDITPEAKPDGAEPMPRRGSSPSPTSAPPPPNAPVRPRGDVWSALTRALAPCIQRLVSCGMIKPDVARHLLALPPGFMPRTPQQTVAVLQAHSGDWSVEYSAGLQEALEAVPPHTPRAPATAYSDAKPSWAEESLLLVHPACKALHAGLMGPRVYAEHNIQFVKTLFEQHFRSVLMKRGKLSRSATEWVVDSLMDILREKVEEGELQLLELEVTIVALRRR